MNEVLKRNCFQFSGGDSITLYQRNIFNLLKPSSILEGGLASSVKWGNRFVAWSWGDEVRIYDMEEEAMISRVRFEWENNALLNSVIEPSSLGTVNSGSKESLIQTLHAKYRCNIFWKDKYTVFIGWADIIKICQVVEIKDKTNTNGGGPSHYVKISCMFSTDFWTCGISSFGCYTTVLSLDKEFMAIARDQGEYTRANQLPSVQILETEAVSYNAVQADALRLRGYTEYKSLDYHLESLIDEILFFVISPKDIILAKARDQDDHVQWLMEHK